MHLPWRDIAHKPGLPSIPTSLLDEEMAELGHLACGRRVCEFGSAFGYSAIGMALNGADCVDAYDPHAWIARSYENMTANVHAYAVGGVVTIHRQPSSECTGTGYGLVFIDGDHSYEGCAADIALAQRIVAPGGYIACHDYGEDCCCPAVRTACDEFLRHGELTGTLWVVKVPA